MQNNELKKLGEKIAKCLALANSDNPAEAAAAQRQAEALMRRYNITTDDVAAANVREHIEVTGGRNRPPIWLCRLANLIAHAFACQVVFSPGSGSATSVATFVGLSHKPELAGYTFEVLSRQLKKSRREYQTTLKRYKRENKIRMADLFAEAWLFRVSKQVVEFAGSEAEQQAIAAYKKTRWGALDTDKRKQQYDPKSERDLHAVIAGHQAADGVSLHRPVNENKTRRLGFGG